MLSVSRIGTLPGVFIRRPELVSYIEIVLAVQGLVMIVQRSQARADQPSCRPSQQFRLRQTAVERNHLLMAQLDQAQH